MINERWCVRPEFDDAAPADALFLSMLIHFATDAEPWPAETASIPVVGVRLQRTSRCGSVSATLVLVPGNDGSRRLLMSVPDAPRTQRGNAGGGDAVVAGRARLRMAPAHGDADGSHGTRIAGVAPAAGTRKCVPGTLSLPLRAQRSWFRTHKARNRVHGCETGPYVAPGLATYAAMAVRRTCTRAQLGVLPQWPHHPAPGFPQKKCAAHPVVNLVPILGVDRTAHCVYVPHRVRVSLQSAHSKMTLADICAVLSRR